jgi:DNA-binding MarR family transcriptional regulator
MTETDLSFSHPSPIFVAGSSDAAIARARRTVDAFGMRLAGAVAVEGASARLRQQVSASALWIELDDLGEGSEALLSACNADVRDGRYRAVVAAPLALIDPLSSILDDDVQLLIDAEETERTAALALAIARRGEKQSLSDVASDRSAERLRQLSDEVSRIASTLARLSTGPAAAPRAPDPAPVADSPPVAAEAVRSVIRARRLRARYFSEELFADPAWDMLLDLLQAEISQLRVPVSSLCIAAAVPATTALRWLKTMVQAGLFVRRADPHDGRRVFVELAPQASHSLRRYFAEVGTVPVI